MPLCLQHGEAFDETVTVAGLDLTVETVLEAHVRTASGADDPPSVELTLTASPVGTTGGTVRLQATLVEVAALATGGYVWDLFVGAPSDPAPLRMLAGPVNVTGRITDSGGDGSGVPGPADGVEDGGP